MPTDSSVPLLHCSYPKNINVGPEFIYALKKRYIQKWAYTELSKRPIGL
jgi:hypothetical protein